jgi:hypothetical protein
MPCHDMQPHPHRRSLRAPHRRSCPGGLSSPYAGPMGRGGVRHRIPGFSRSPPRPDLRGLAGGIRTPRTATGCGRQRADTRRCPAPRDSRRRPSHRAGPRGTRGAVLTMKTKLLRKLAAETRRRERDAKRELRRLLRASREAHLSHPGDPHSAPSGEIPAHERRQIEPARVVGSTAAVERDEGGPPVLPPTRGQDG